MPVFSFTVGSLGDILAVLELAWKLKRILTEARAASGEVQELINDLDAFSQVLQTAETALGPNPEPSIANGVNHALAVCFGVLKRMHDKLEAFQGSLMRKRRLQRWTQGMWSLYAWTALGGKGEVEAFKRRLNEQVEVVQVMLGALSVSSLKKIEQRCEDENVKVDRILHLLEVAPKRMTFDESSLPFRFFDGQGKAYAPMDRYPISIFLRLFSLLVSWGHEYDLLFLVSALLNPVMWNKLIWLRVSPVWALGDDESYGSVAFIYFYVAEVPWSPEGLAVAVSPAYLRVEEPTPFGFFVSPDITHVMRTSFMLHNRLLDALGDPAATWNNAVRAHKAALAQEFPLQPYDVSQNLIKNRYKSVEALLAVIKETSNRGPRDRWDVFLLLEEDEDVKLSEDENLALLLEYTACDLLQDVVSSFAGSVVELLYRGHLYPAVGKRTGDLEWRKWPEGFTPYSRFAAGVRRMVVTTVRRRRRLLHKV